MRGSRGRVLFGGYMSLGGEPNGRVEKSKMADLELYLEFLSTFGKFYATAVAGRRTAKRVCRLLSSCSVDAPQCWRALLPLDVIRRVPCGSEQIATRCLPSVRIQVAALIHGVPSLNLIVGRDYFRQARFPYAVEGPAAPRFLAAFLQARLPCCS